MKKVIITLIKVIMIAIPLVLAYKIHWSFLLFLVLPIYGILTEK